jgi:hypothetical protein
VTGGEGPVSPLSSKIRIQAERERNIANQSRSLTRISEQSNDPGDTIETQGKSESSIYSNTNPETNHFALGPDQKKRKEVK